MDKITVYTSGSAIGGRAEETKCGWACKLIYKRKELIKSGSDKGKTDEQMKVIAVLMAIQSITNKNIPVEVFCDSEYVVSALNHECAIQKDIDLWKELIEEIYRFTYIKFFSTKEYDELKPNEDVIKKALEESLKI